MSAFLIIRAIFFALFILVNGAVCAAAAVNIAASPESAIKSLDIYLIIYSAASILFMFPLILVDVLRRGAVMSTSGKPPTLFTPRSTIFTLIFTLNQRHACACRRCFCVDSSRAHFIMQTVRRRLVVLLVTDSDSGHVDGRYFGQLTLNPNPTVDRLERMAETWQPAPAPPMTQVRVQAMTVTPLNRPAQEVPRSTEPQPLTLANAPELPPTRAPVHYTASAVVSVGVLPGRRPSIKKKPAPSAQAPPALYPAYVQAATSSTPKRNSTAPETITFHSPPRGSNLAGSNPSDEPLPIQNWPRVNPQEPLRKNRTSNTPVVPSMQTQVVSLGTPGPAPISSTFTPASPPTRRTSNPRRRPPPLDLSAASPVRVH
ncbi:hypothetical protein FRB90_007086 [Tulasnella sp. 427]|nr:hypothetical protein FRB90_007086 [Tulasnella sp. 427]